MRPPGATGLLIQQVQLEAEARRPAGAAAPPPSGHRQRGGGSAPLTCRGVSFLSPRPPHPFPGELSREKPEEDGRALFFGLRPRWHWPRRGPGSWWCRGSLSTSSPQRARALSYPAEGRLLFPREMRPSGARGLSASSCCAGGSRPPL